MDAGVVAVGRRLYEGVDEGNIRKQILKYLS